MDRAEICVDVISGILANGTHWIGAGSQRLQSIAKGGSASQGSLNRLEKRLNVLTVFLNFLKFQASKDEGPEQALFGGGHLSIRDKLTFLEILRAIPKIKPVLNKTGHFIRPFSII
jgi:hypothetical protein